MTPTMRAAWSGTIRLALLAGVLVGLVGCTSGFGLFGRPETHKLTEQAKMMRAMAPDNIPAPRELTEQLHPPHIVEPGDVLLVQPASFESTVRLPGDQPVLPDGTINLGEYGRLVAAGKLLPQIEQEAQTLVQLKTKDAGAITVRLISRQSKVFYVLGEVNAPGAFVLTGREKVLDAILIAGGLTDNASRGKIILSRPTPPDGCRVVIPIRYNDIVQLGDTTTNYQVLAGDRIFVASKSFCENLPFWKPSSDEEGCRPQTPCATEVVPIQDPHLSWKEGKDLSSQGALPWHPRPAGPPETIRGVAIDRPPGGVPEQAPAPAPLGASPP